MVSGLGRSVFHNPYTDPILTLQVGGVAGGKAGTGEEIWRCLRCLSEESAGILSHYPCCSTANHSDLDYSGHFIRLGSYRTDRSDSIAAV